VARGELRIYLGASPGVGKTYAMLDEGYRRRGRGTDVVVGFVDTNDRPATRSQLRDLEIVAPIDGPVCEVVAVAKRDLVAGDVLDEYFVTVELLKGADRQTLVIALISGGGSALMALPVEGISLEDYRRTSDLLLTIPATIDEVNAVGAARRDEVHEQPVAIDPSPASYICMRRQWSNGDRVTLDLRMAVRVKRWDKNMNAASVGYGPLWFSLSIMTCSPLVTSAVPLTTTQCSARWWCICRDRDWRGATVRRLT
jgi:hypothetical protein